MNCHLNLPNVLVAATQCKMFCMHQEESTSVSGRKKLADKDLANATACLDYTCMFGVESFSTCSFRIKLISAETPAGAARTRAEQVNPFERMMNMQANYTFLPPLLTHERMYANHHLYNELIVFLETNGLGWYSLGTP